MKFSLSAAAITVALAASASAERCTRESITGFIWRYHVRSESKVADIPGICGGLWDNLKQFGECATPSNTWCGDAGDGILGWDFNVFNGCKGGMVEATWWDATTNNFGGINCP